LPGRRVADVSGPQCPLRGVVTALSAAREARVLVVAVDLPLLTADLLLALTAWPKDDLVAPRWEDRIERLCAVYARDAALPIAREALASERLGLRDVTAKLSGSFLEGDDLAALGPASELLLRVDHAVDLARAAALAAD
jgi:molybdopterin-guanine dinucleotide biosynthesis protein A